MGGRPLHNMRGLGSTDILRTEPPSMERYFRHTPEIRFSAGEVLPDAGSPGMSKTAYSEEDVNSLGVLVSGEHRPRLDDGATQDTDPNTDAFFEDPDREYAEAIGWTIGLEDQIEDSIQVVDPEQPVIDPRLVLRVTPNEDGGTYEFGINHTPLPPQHTPAQMHAGYHAPLDSLWGVSLVAGEDDDTGLTATADLRRIKPALPTALVEKFKTEALVLLDSDADAMPARINDDLEELKLHPPKSITSYQLSYLSGLLRWARSEDNDAEPNVLLRIIHFISMRIVEIVDDATEGNDRLIKGVIRGHSNGLYHAYDFALRYELENAAQMTRADVMRVTDIIFARATMGRETATGIEIRNAVILMNAATRYRVLGETEKTDSARRVMDYWVSEYGYSTSDPVEDLIADFTGTPFSTIAQNIVQEDNDYGIGLSMWNHSSAVRVLAVWTGYSEAEKLYTRIADQLAETPGGAEYVDYYREQAAASRSIGLMLGLIAD